MNNRRFLDFWLLGGISILAWAILALGEYGRFHYSFIDQRMGQITATFAVLGLICNHPHFMASYFLAYGRGSSFLFRHWICLVLTPILLLALFVWSYLNLDVAPETLSWIPKLNLFFSTLGIGYRFGEAPTVGADLLGVSILIMFLTVGWHYSKQVFGCTMVYANYDNYPISKNQRSVLKFGVFGVAAYTLFHVILRWRYFDPSGSRFQMMGMPVTELGLPAWLDVVSVVWLITGAAAILYFIILENYRKFRKWPSSNFVIPLLAFYVWWVPIYPQKEYYLMMVPFFHGLQYLGFAYRLDKEERSEVKFTLRYLALFFIGFLAFEGVPGALDFHIQTAVPIFFTVAFIVFINVHHFFIDSVLWRFQDTRVRETLLSMNDKRRKEF